MHPIRTDASHPVRPSTPPIHPPRPPLETLPVTPSLLTFSDAGFAYPAPSGEGFASPVVSGLSLDLRPGEVTLLCGESGCGKSTALKMANGLIPHYVKGCLFGEVLLGGTPLGQMPLHEVSQRVGSVFQNPRTQLFNAEVRSELAFACENAGIDPDEIRRRIERIARALHCEELLGRSIFALSGGERQKVACMCVSVLDPDVVVLDEPSSNLDARAIDELRSFVASWKRAGKAILVAEHRLYYLRDLVDMAIYLDHGTPAHAWSGAELRALNARATDELGLRHIHPEACRPAAKTSAPASAPAPDPEATPGAVSEAAPGTSPTPAAAPSPASSATPPFAHIRDLTCDYGSRRARRRALDIDALDLPLGVPIALIGRNGAGKSTLLRTLCGLSRHAGGTCTLPTSATSSADALVEPASSEAVPAGPGGSAATPPLDARARLSRSYLVMQDVTCQLFCPSVREEVHLGQPATDSADARRHTDEILAELDLAQFADAHPLALSGGQQQRVSIAAALVCGREIVLFDEPTSGLDLRHMHRVARLIERVAAPDRLVLVISHDYEFVCACCQHAVQLGRGRVVDSYALDSPSGAARLHAFFWDDEDPAL